MSALGTAAQLEPQNAQYGYVLAVALHESGKVEQARAELERLLNVQPANRSVRRSLIQYNLDSGQAAKARVLLEDWKTINTGDPLLQ